MEAPESPKVLVTGATGFVGAALLERLRTSADLDLRALVRDASRLDDGDRLEVVEADLSDPETLPPALDGVDVAYYLVHSMEPGGGAGFADRDREAAENFAAASRRCGVRRTIYLGGLESSDGEESEHLESRTEVAEILESRGSQEFVALKASMVVGAGSSSFQALVQLVDRLPVLVLPNWRERRSQSVGIDDVVAALVAAIDVDPGSYDIAGADTLSFERMTEIVGELLGDSKPSIPMPFSNAKLEGATAAAIVDGDRELLEPLMAGLHGDLVTDSNSLQSVFGIEPDGFRSSAKVAISGIET